MLHILSKLKLFSYFKLYFVVHIYILLYIVYIYIYIYIYRERERERERCTFTPRLEPLDYKSNSQAIRPRLIREVSLSTLDTTTEVPLSKTPNPQLLPGYSSINGCPMLRGVCSRCVCMFTAVCVCVCVCTLDGKCRARISGITSLSLYMLSD